MSLDILLTYFITHNTTAIEGLFVLILLTILFLSAKAFMSPQRVEEPSGAQMDLSGIESTLRKMMEQMGPSPVQKISLAQAEEHNKIVNSEEMNQESSKATGDAPTGVTESSQPNGELQALKEALEEREKEIQALKAKAATPAASSSNDSEESQKLLAKVKDLEGKLAEYEIIEEDIADLSFFKEENQKLSGEVELLKAQLENAKKVPPATPAVESVVESVSDPVDVPETTSEVNATAGIAASAEKTQEFVDAALEAREENPVSSEPAVVEPTSDPASDDIMSEFAAAVGDQKASKDIEVEKQVSVPAAVIHEDLKGQNEPPPAIEPVEKESVDVNVDKMMTEALDLSTADASPVQNSLESELNTDKLLLEATDLEEKK